LSAERQLRVAQRKTFVAPLPRESLIESWSQTAWPTMLPPLRVFVCDELEPFVEL
jgi:hypothetical protein